MKSSTVFKLFIWAFFIAACICMWVIIYYKNWFFWALLAIAIGGMWLAYHLKCESKAFGI